MKKRGSIELSMNSIIVIIIVIIVAALLMAFVTGSFQSSTTKIVEKIEEENDPAPPDEQNPITLSRSYVKTTRGSDEIIKVAVLNPTSEDWTDRLDMYPGFLGCGAADNICYVSDTCDGLDDLDCLGFPERECNFGTTGDGVCLVNEESGDIMDPEDGLEKVCPLGAEGGIGQDCGPQPGIDVLVKCDESIFLNSVSQAKVIPAGVTESFTVILRVEAAQAGNYLCQIKLFGEGIEDFQKDLRIEVL